MNSEEFRWQGLNWLTHPKWGWFHPDRHNYYWDASQLNLDPNNGNLLVSTSYKPQTVEYKGKEELRPYACGLCRTTDEFTYGTFIAHLKLPIGANLWPSFWLSAANSWPPEIDILEGYTDEKGSYRKNFLRDRLEPNYHYGNTPENHEQKGARTVCRGIIKLNDFNEYKLIWTPEWIEIRYNGYLVYSVTAKKKLQWLNDDPWMHVKFNLNVNPDYNNKTSSPTMIVKDFTYKPL